MKLAFVIVAVILFLLAAALEVVAVPKGFRVCLAIGLAFAWASGALP